MGKNIKESLIKLFSQYRIVFWHDYKKEMLEDFQKIKLDNIEKIEINRNEFSTKYKILKEQPNQKYLIYKRELNNKEENLLLDIELYSGIFNTIFRTCSN